jgi:hypothetical protein
MSCRLALLIHAGGALANPLTFDFLDIGLPSLAASAYSTQLLAQRKMATQGVSRIIAGDSITGTIECSGFTLCAYDFSHRC